MRRLILKWDSGIPEAVFHSLSLWSAEGVLCPGLRLLHWESHSRILPLHRLVLSPTLNNLSLTYSSYYYESPELELSIIQPAIMGLDTSPLRDLRLQWYVSAESSKQMEFVASSAVLRCGPALKNLAMYSPLSDAAVQHTMQLPNLCTWHTMKGPPRIPNLSLSDSFPRLDHLSLISEASYEWLPLFTATPRHISFGQRFCSPPNSGPTKRLGRLVAHWRIPIDAVFMAPVMLFRELISLRLTSACSTGLIAAPSCAFSSTDDDIADIAAALPRLKVAHVFGQLMPNHRHLPRLIFHVLQGLGTSGNSLQHGKSSQRPRARVYGPST